MAERSKAPASSPGHPRWRGFESHLWQTFFWHKSEGLHQLGSQSAVMCRLNVAYCPSCKHYSPVFVLSSSESRPNYTLVYDTKCQKFFCRRHLQVETPWVPDPRGKKGEDGLGPCCEQCSPGDCRVDITYRDCCLESRNRLLEGWLVRKVPDKWSNPIFCYAQLEETWL